MRHQDTLAPGAFGSLLGLLAAVVILLTALAAVEVARGDQTAYVLYALCHAAAYSLAVIVVLRSRARGLDLLLILCVAVLVRAIAMWAPPNLPGGAVATADMTTGYAPFIDLVTHAVSALPGGITGRQIVMAGAEGVVMLALLGWLKAQDLPRERVLIYAWHPLPLWELTGMAHVEAVTIAVLMLSIVATARRQRGMAGGLLAMAAALRWLPLVLLPALWRRRGRSMPTLLALGGLAIVAGCAIIAGHPPQLPDWPWRLPDQALADLGRQPIALLQEAGFRFVPTSMQYAVVALLIMVALSAMALWRRGIEDVRAVDLVALAGVSTLLLAPERPWLLAWLVPLLVGYASPSTLLLTLTCVAQYLASQAAWATPANLYAATYGVFALTLVLEGAWHLKPAAVTAAQPLRREPEPSPSPAPAVPVEAIAAAAPL